MELSDIRKIAKKNNWTEIDFQEKNKMISFANAIGQECRVNIYFTTMTAGVVYPNPEEKYGRRKQEYVYDVTAGTLTKILTAVAPGGCYKVGRKIQLPVPGRS